MWDTVNANVFGCASKTLLISVPLPTPVGPDITIGRGSGSVTSWVICGSGWGGRDLPGGIWFMNDWGWICVRAVWFTI